MSVCGIFFSFMLRDDNAKWVHISLNHISLLPGSWPSITRSLEALLAQAAAPQAGIVDDSAAPVGR